MLFQNKIGSMIDLFPNPRFKVESSSPLCPHFELVGVGEFSLDKGGVGRGGVNKRVYTFSVYLMIRAGCE